MADTIDAPAQIAPYDLEQLLLHEKPSSLVLNVGRDDVLNKPILSLSYLTKYIEERLIFDEDSVKSAKKLYVIGNWNFSYDETAVMLETQQAQHSAVGPEELEWNQGVAIICKLLKKMENIKELTWVTSLPFTKVVWEFLSTALEKLVIDVGNAVQVDVHDKYRPIYLKQESMKPLTQFTKLKELRLFNMRDSYQLVVWETIFRNRTSMRILEMTMADAPITRGHGWIKADDVTGLQAHSISAYKGVEAKGILHHNYGMGEYLDDFCMRRARQNAGIDEARPLPLWCLKLDGFVVDQLPFLAELRHIVLLCCGSKCVDAGLRAPQTYYAHDLWNGYKVDVNVVTHCVIMFPRWNSIYDANGNVAAREGSGLMDAVRNAAEEDDQGFEGDTEDESYEEVNEEG